MAERERKGLGAVKAVGRPLGRAWVSVCGVVESCFGMCEAASLSWVELVIITVLVGSIVPVASWCHTVPQTLQVNAAGGSPPEYQILSEGSLGGDLLAGVPVGIAKKQIPSPAPAGAVGGPWQEPVLLHPARAPALVVGPEGQPRRVLPLL